MKSQQIKTSSNRSFGFVFFLFFLIIAVYPLFNSNSIYYWALFISFIFLVLSIMNSKILTPLNKIWFKFGLLIGLIISPLVMGLIYFVVVTPTSFIMKILGKDILNLKKNDKKNTYWIQKSEPKSKMKKQF